MHDRSIFLARSCSGRRLADFFALDVSVRPDVAHFQLLYVCPAPGGFSHSSRRAVHVAHSFTASSFKQPHDHFANGFQNFFRTYLLGSFDNSMQPQPTAAAATTTESAGTAVQVLRCCINLLNICRAATFFCFSQVLYVIVLAALILISSIGALGEGGVCPENGVASDRAAPVRCSSYGHSYCHYDSCV